jgi:hypothetical protein
MNSEIQHIIPPRDYEIIRDRIGLILKTEIFRQSAINYDDSIDADVYVQRSKPISPEECPLVNVMIDDGQFSNHDPISMDGLYNFFIDIVTTAKGTDEQRGDSRSAYISHRIAGICQGILRSPEWADLGFGTNGSLIISRTTLNSFSSGVVEQGEATNLTVTRIIFSVLSSEQEPEQTGVELNQSFSQFYLGETQNGMCFLYGDGFNPPPPIGCNPAHIFNSNGEFDENIPSGGQYELPDTPVVVKDENGQTIGSGEVSSVSGGEIEVNTSCAPVNVKVYNSDESIDINQNVISGGSFDYAIPNVTITVKDQNNNTLATDVLPGGTNGQIDVNIPPCEDGTVNVKNSLDEILDTVTVASGGTAESNISNSEISVNSTNVASVPATNSVNIYLVDEEANPIEATISTETITIPNTNVTVNGEAFLSQLASEFGLNIELFDQNDNLISATLEAPKIIVNIPICPPVINYPSGLVQTGSESSIGTGDDGNTRRGWLQDWLTLPSDSPNIWGRFERFTGVTGGYHDGAQFRSVNGVALGNSSSAFSQAFPDAIIVNWATRNRSNNKVLGICQTAISESGNWQAKRASCLAFSTPLYPNGWLAPNFNEVMSYMKLEGSALANYPPFNAASGSTGTSGFSGLSQFFWTFTPSNNALTTAYMITPNTATSTKIAQVNITDTARNAHAVRYFTINGTNLT